jgi:hypothetical protein
MVTQCSYQAYYGHILNYLKVTGWVNIKTNKKKKISRREKRFKRKISAKTLHVLTHI